MPFLRKSLSIFSCIESTRQSAYKYALTNNDKFRSKTKTVFRSTSLLPSIMFI